MRSHRGVMAARQREIRLPAKAKACDVCANAAFRISTLQRLCLHGVILTAAAWLSVDGVPRYRWTVSTGRAGYGTPNGTYQPQRMEKTWFSKEYYNSPLPHSIFFHGGYAIHGSYEIHRLGGPASHGCIRLHPANAATLFALVKQKGMSDTTIVVSGGNRSR
jgi:L,D-transpeptidase-like protein